MIGIFTQYIEQKYLYLACSAWYTICGIIIKMVLRWFYNPSVENEVWRKVENLVPKRIYDTLSHLIGHVNLNKLYMLYNLCTGRYPPTWGYALPTTLYLFIIAQHVYIKILYMLYNLYNNMKVITVSYKMYKLYMLYNILYLGRGDGEEGEGIKPPISTY